MSDYLLKLLHLNLNWTFPRTEEGLQVLHKQILHRPTAFSHSSYRTKPLPDVMVGLKKPGRFEGSFNYGLEI